MIFFNDKKNFDFVAIGDITTDAFIRIKEAEVYLDQKTNREKLSIGFGDKVPYESVEIIRAVGNSANASVSASRLGLKSALVSVVGDDQNGEECIKTLEKNGVDTQFIKIQKEKETNYHYVLWFKEERTILVKHQDYQYGLPDIGNPKWIYLSSMGENTLEYHKQISIFLSKNPDVKLAFQPGTFQIKMGLEKISSLYTKANILFCNTEEARKIIKKPEYDIKNLLRALKDIGANVVVITDGPRGAYGFDGYDGYFMPAYPDTKPPFERTGAGDAFASTFTSALAHGRSLFDAFLWSPINSMSVVQQVGAQRGLLTQEEILKFLIKAPSGYRPQKIM